MKYEVEFLELLLHVNKNYLTKFVNCYNFLIAISS